MFGVVLWSDEVRNRAVIWCEDHGNLAFFSGEGIESLEGADLEPGDLVQFDIRSERNMRLASSPRLVAQDEYPTLAQDLKLAGTGQTPVAVNSAVSGSSGKIIAFEPRTAAPNSSTAARRIS